MFKQIARVFLGVVMISGTMSFRVAHGEQAVPPQLRVAFEVADITPTLQKGQPVWLAGYGWGREATGVHDPLFARCVVMSDGARRVAMVSVDLVGLQYPEVEKIRQRLPQFDYVLVASTHNHEGPDTIGLWGQKPWKRGVDPTYLEQVVETVVRSVQNAEQRMQPADVQYGTATDEELLGDSRKPFAKDGVLRILRFNGLADRQTLGVLVQWNCHPEAMGPRNTLLTADFPSTTISELERRLSAPVAYFSGALGGLMAPPDGKFVTDDGRVLLEGDFAYAEAYGRAVAQLSEAALATSRPISLVPFTCSFAKVTIPVDNAAYRTARLLGVLRRQAAGWTGDFHETSAPAIKPGEFAVVTEVGCCRLGELHLAAIPGELYPELVYGKFQDPAEAHADFPDAPLEVTISQLLGDRPWMLFGLANDEIGYIIPKRQWDVRPPYAYGRERPQYGEINSCGPDVAPILMKAFEERVVALEDAAHPASQ